MADDVLNRLRAANPVPDPDRLAVAGDAAEPVDPELQELLHRARRIRADETDDELIERRRTEERVIRALPVHERDSRRLAWAAAAALLVVVASSLVWTAARVTAPEVDVVDQPPGPAPSEQAAAIPAGTEASCEGDGRTGFVVGPDGAVRPGDPPQGERVPEPEMDAKGKTGGTLPRIVNRVSLTEASLALNRGSLVVTFEPQGAGGEPAGDVWHTLWLRSVDGEQTGVVRARGAGAAFEDHQVLAGSDPNDLRPIDARLVQERRWNAGPGGAMRLVVPADALSVMRGPFLWAFEVRNAQLGAGDICPAEVDPADPFSDPGALARFPDDGTGGR